MTSRPTHRFGLSGGTGAGKAVRSFYIDFTWRQYAGNAHGLEYAQDEEKGGRAMNTLALIWALGLAVVFVGLSWVRA